MNTTTDVASSTASNELVSVLGRSFVLDGGNLIVDALVVYKNGKGSPKAIDVATPFLSGTNVQIGRVKPTKSLYDPSTGNYHFEIPVQTDLSKDMEYTFDFNMTVDGQVQAVRLSGTVAANPEYSLERDSVYFENNRLVVAYNITAHNGEDILVATAKPNIVTNLSNRGTDAPEVTLKGNRVLLKWNSAIDNSVAQIFAASGALNIGTSAVFYSFAIETQPITIVKQTVVFAGNEVKLTLDLDDECKGPFNFFNLAIKENGLAVKTIGSVPEVLGNRVSVRLVRTVPTTNKIEYAITGEICLGGNENRRIPFEFETVDYVKAPPVNSRVIQVENVKHTYANGEEVAVFKLTLDNDEQTPLSNIDGLRLSAPADLSRRNRVEYDPTTGLMTVTRSLTTVGGILTTRGSILSYDYGEEVLEGEFHSSLTIEADPYRPVSNTAPEFNTVLYSGGDTDLSVVVYLAMANGEVPTNARIIDVHNTQNVDASGLIGRNSYQQSGYLSFQVPVTRLDEMKDDKYKLTIMVEAETPSGTYSFPIHMEHKPTKRNRPMSLETVYAGKSIEPTITTIHYQLNNIPLGQEDNLVVDNYNILGIENQTAICQRGKLLISGHAPGDESTLITSGVYQVSGTVVIRNKVTGEKISMALPSIVVGPQAAATPISSMYVDGCVEFSWVVRDALGLVPETVNVNRNSWELPVTLGNPVGEPRYNKSTGILTQAFKAIEGDVDGTYAIRAKFQLPLPDVNIYSIESVFEHRKSDNAVKTINLRADGTTVNVADLTADAFFAIDLPKGITEDQLSLAGVQFRNGDATSVVRHTFSGGRLVVTVALDPFKVNQHFVVDMRVDVSGPNARGHVNGLIVSDKPVDRFTLLGAAYHKEGFVRYYAKAPEVDVGRLGYITKYHSNDVTNYPAKVTTDIHTGAIVIEYQVKSNEFVGRTYTVQGTINLGEEVANFGYDLTVKAIKPLYNNFILNSGGTVVDHKRGRMRINFDIQGFGMGGIGHPEEVGIKVIGKGGVFKHDGDIVYEYDQASGKGFYVVEIHDRSVSRYPNAELKVIITSPNVGNDYHGVITGFSGQDNTCELISTRLVPNKGDVVFRVGVGYGYPTPTRPVLVNFLSGFQFVEGIDGANPPHDIKYDKETGILEFRVKGNARPMGDTLYSGIATLGVVDSKGKSSQIPLNIYTVIRDNNVARTLSEELINVRTFEGRSQFTLRLGYVDYLYPPEYPMISCSSPNASVEYDKVKGLALVTIVGDITSAYSSSISGTCFIQDELSTVVVKGQSVPVMSRIPLLDANGPEGIHQLSQQWTEEGILFSLSTRVNGNKPASVELVEIQKGLAFNLDEIKLDYDHRSGLIYIHVDASKPKFAPLSIRGKLKIATDHVVHEVIVDSGMVYPEGITRVQSARYNKETKRIEVSWILYTPEGKYPEKVNMNTRVEWVNTVGLNTAHPTKERYNQNTGVYYAEFAPAQRLTGLKAFAGSTILTTGKENIPVKFTVSI